MGRYIELDYTRWFQTSIVSSPYKAYIPHPLNGWVPTLPPHTRDLVRLAEHRIADFRQDLTDISPTLRLVLTRAEGLATSSVENIRTTMRSMSLLESLRGRRRHATDLKDKLTFGSVHMNTEALGLADRPDKDVTAADIEHLHRVLFTGTTEQSDSGRFRRELVWIGRGHQNPSTAHFVPPPYAEVPELMRDLAAYISDRTVWAPSIVKAAVAHAQFETIHPFTDGNGRVGRALTNLVLRRDGHLRIPVPLSASIDARRDDYYSSLQASRFVGDRTDDEASAAVSPAVEFTADALVVACDYAAAVEQQIARWESKCTAIPARARSSTDAILGVTRFHPAATLPFLVEHSGLNRRTAARALSRLTDLGVLAEIYDDETGARVFEAAGLMNVVDERDRLLSEAWQMHLSGQTGIPERLSQIAHGTHPKKPVAETTESVASAAARSAAAAPRCGHIGPRSRKPCRRRRGHTGPHAY